MRPFEPEKGALAGMEMSWKGFSLGEVRTDISGLAGFP